MLTWTERKPKVGLSEFGAAGAKKINVKRALPMLLSQKQGGPAAIPLRDAGHRKA